MLQEQQRSVADARQASAKAAGVAQAVELVADRLLDLFPLDAKGWVREHIVELLPNQAIVTKRVAKLDICRVMAFDHHIGFADRIGFGVDLLPKQFEP